MAYVQFSSLCSVMNTFDMRAKRIRVSDKITHEVTCCVHPSFLQGLLMLRILEEAKEEIWPHR